MTERPLPVVVNRSGGTAAKLGSTLADRLQEHFSRAGLTIDLNLAEGHEIDAVIGRMAGAPVVAVGGGDGTLGHAAGILSAAGSAMAVLPLGTRNHLAKQLGIPAELEEAARIIAAGNRQRIDLGRAGQRVFVNNASVGLYTRLVRNRDALPGPKWLGNIGAALHVLRHLHSRPLALEIDGTGSIVKTPLLFIGNNRYSLEGSNIGERESLTDGALSFYAVAARAPLELIWMAIRTLLGHADPERDFCALAEGRTARISGGATLDVACDGEVQHMPLPLELEILPRALEVIVP